MTLYDGVFLVPLVFNLVALLGGWLYYTHRTSWPGRPAAQGKIYRCSSCSHVYVGDRDVPMSRCPACGTFNEAIKR